MPMKRYGPGTVAPPHSDEAYRMEVLRALRAVRGWVTFLGIVVVVELCAGVVVGLVLAAA